MPLFWRGVPEIDEGPEFYWKSPDGSKVLGYLLPDGYYQTAFQETQYEGDESKRRQSGQTIYYPGWVSLLMVHRKILVNVKVDFDLTQKQLARGLVPVGGDHLYPPLSLSSLG